MWEGLDSSLDNASTQSARSLILHKFSTSRPGGDEKVAEYFIRISAHLQQLAGTPDAIPYHAFRSHIYNTLMGNFSVIITILQEKQPAPTPEEVMRTMETHADSVEASKLTEVASAVTATDGLYASGCDQGCRGGRGGTGKGKGGTAAQTEKWTTI